MRALQGGAVVRSAAARGACGERVHLEGRGDGETGGGVAIEDVHELLLLDRADHHRAAARVGRHKLAGHDAAAAALAVDFGVDLLEAALLDRVLHDDDLTRVRAHDHVVAAATCVRHSEGNERGRVRGGGCCCHGGPVRRKVAIERIMPKTSLEWIVCTLPLSSGRMSSRILPLATMSSCCFGAEKLPKTAAVMPLAF